MKQLFILRHSKAGQTNKKILDDHERTLTQKGIDVAILTGKYFNEQEYAPEHVLTSTAIRAKETGEYVVNELLKKPTVELSNKLYLASDNDIYQRLRKIDNSIDKLLVIGHNPGLQQFAMSISGSGDKKKFREMRNNFPPRSLAVFNLAINDWSEIAQQVGELTDFHISRV